ncbi:MAG TPA: hypothetical protein VJ842_13065 [Pyrinomonadaceae bacterium]|nr:hypothetical protein [Pyrinomonadaceae bacterium]
MLKKFLCLALAGLLINMVSVSPVYAGSKEEKQARFAEQVKAGILKLGTGTDARVEVKLRDKTKLKGYIGEAGADSFVVVDAKMGVATTVAYPQVKQVRGNNLSTGARIAISVGLSIALLLAVAMVVGVLAED